MDLIGIARDLGRDVDRLRFGPPVTHVYNALRYAWEPYEAYLRRYGTPPREVVLVGMNPGPFGMVQTGVPFGDARMVRDFLGIEGRVGRPAREHPKRPIQGFACARSEVSGTRVWSWARDTFGTADRFFARFFILNYCPLCFMQESGANVTPDKLAAAEREPLFRLCDRALRRQVEVLQPRFVVGIGAFAEQRAAAALAGLDVVIGRILHPSPASPLANRGWAQEVTSMLRALGVDI